MGLGLACQKQGLGQILAGAGPREHPEKNWDPLLISATVEASNFKFGTQLRFGTCLPKKERLSPKLAGVLARKHQNKNWDPLLISATVEASNFKFGIQLWFGTHSLTHCCA